MDTWNRLNDSNNVNCPKSSKSFNRYAQFKSFKWSELGFTYQLP